MHISWDILYKGQLTACSHFYDTDAMIQMVTDWTLNNWIFEKLLIAWRQLVWRAMLLMVNCSDELFVTQLYNYFFCVCYHCSYCIFVLICFAIVSAYVLFYSFTTSLYSSALCMYFCVHGLCGINTAQENSGVRLSVHKTHTASIPACKLLCVYDSVLRNKT